MSFVTLDVLLRELLSFAKVRFSGLFSGVFWYIELKCRIWIAFDLIKCEFEFRHAWPTFTGVIPIWWNLVFRTFLCSLLKYWLEISYMNLSSCFTEHIQLLSHLIHFHLSYPNFSVSPYKIMTWIFWDGFISTLYRSSSTFGSLWSVFWGVMPFVNLLAPVEDLYCFSSTFRMIVFFHVGVTDVGENSLQTPSTLD